MTRLNRGAQLLYEFLKAQPTGAEVSRDQVMQAMKWKESTLKTYLTKNMLARFMRELPNGRFKIVHGQESVTEEDIEGAFSQKKPATLVLSRGETLTGKRDRYTLTSPLGEGSVGHVWRAQPASGGGTVAVKVVNPRPDLLKESVFTEVKARFAREAENGPQLSHPALIRYLDAGSFREHPFLAMELAERSVADMLAESGALSSSLASTIAFSAAQALDYLHAQACVHRDVKPHNILKAERGFVLADLGIVRWEDLNPAFVSAGTITKESIQLGSWHYMAPEQQRSAHAAVPASDLYSLGVTWYELLTGAAPSPQMVAARDLAPPPTSVEAWRTIQAMVSYRPADRPSLEEVLAAAAVG